MLESSSRNSMKTGKHYGLVLLLFSLLLSLSFMGQSTLFISAPISSAQSSSPSTPNCPANSVLKFVMYGGAPNSVNLLTASVESSFVTLRFMYLGTYPSPYPNGTLDWNDSILSSISSNPNYTRWTFDLKPNVTWSNGQRVTPQDILGTYSSNFALNASFDFLGIHNEVTNVSAVNSTAVVFNLNAPDAHFAERTSDLLFTPVLPQQFRQNGPGYNGYNAVDVADGPFYLTNYSAGETQAVLYRNPYYKPLPKVCEIIESFVESDSQVPTYLSAGSVDLGILEPSSAKSVLSNSNIHLLPEKGLFITGLFYNVSAYPYNMTQFRQALAYGINQTNIDQQAYNGYITNAYTAEGGVPPFATSTYNANQQNYSYNSSKAVALLKSIGITKGSDGLMHYPNGTEVSLTLWVDNTYTSVVLAAGIIQNDLQSLGIKITPQVTSASAIIGDTYANTNNINHAMILYQSGAPIFGDPYADALPAYQILDPFNPYPSWEGPVNSTAQLQYQSNFSAIVATGNPAQEAHYLNNIQNLNSQNLPILVLGYPDLIWGYNTQRWTNWPNSSLMIAPFGRWVGYDLATLAPASGTSSTTASISSSLSATTSSGVSSSGTGTTATTSSSASGSQTLILVIGIVIIVIILAAAFALIRRRRT